MVVSIFTTGNIKGSAAADFQPFMTGTLAAGRTGFDVAESFVGISLRHERDGLLTLSPSWFFRSAPLEVIVRTFHTVYGITDVMSSVMSPFLLQFQRLPSREERSDNETACNHFFQAISVCKVEEKDTDAWYTR